MSKISQAQVKQIASLARINLSAEKIAETTSSLARVIDFVDQLASADTANVEPTSQVTGLTDVLRDDEVLVSNVEPARLLAAVPEREGDYIKVKRVL